MYELLLRQRNRIGFFDEWNSKALPSPQVSRNIRSQTSPNATKAETPPGSRWSYCCHMANVPPPKPGDMGPRDCQQKGILGAKLWLFCHHFNEQRPSCGSKMVQIKPPTDRCQPDEVARRTIVWRLWQRFIEGDNAFTWVTAWWCTPVSKRLQSTHMSSYVYWCVCIYIYIYMVKYSL